MSSFTSNTSWTILKPIEKTIRSKIEDKGVPLNKWDIHINRGILTGLNDAFIISTSKKNELIAADPKSAELIRPILRGRDIKRYQYSYANLWLIYIPWHFPLHLDNTITGVSEKAERLFAKQYTAVYNHLLSFKKELSSRNKAETGIRYEWYALQRWGAKYWNDFYKQKIVWGNLCLSAQFSLVEDEYFINAPSPMIVPGSKYLLAILNSKVADWYIRQLGVTRNGGYFEYKPMFVEQLPVPYINEHQQKLFDEIVDKIHQLKQQGDDTSTLEEDIDNMVFQLYEFTPDEIAYIRSTVL